MACACQKGKKSTPTVYKVVLPDGRTKSYATEVGAQAELKRTPGAYLSTQA